MVQIQPSTTTAVPTIQFDIVGVGEFLLPVLGAKGVPFGITSAFGLFMNAKDGGSDEQKLGAWAQLITTLSDTYPGAVRTMARLDEDDIAAIFEAWGTQSSEYEAPQG